MEIDNMSESERSALISDILELSKDLERKATELYQQGTDIPFGLVFHLAGPEGPSGEYLLSTTAAKLLGNALYGVWLQRQIRKHRHATSAEAAAWATFVTLSINQGKSFPAISCRIEQGPMSLNCLSQFLPPASPDPAVTPLLKFSRPDGPRLFSSDPAPSIQEVSDSYTETLSHFQAACDKTAKLIQAQRFAEATEPALFALRMTVELYGVSHNQLCRSLSNVGWIFSEVGEGRKAITAYELAIEVAREIEDSDRLEKYERELKAEKARWRNSLGDWSSTALCCGQ